MPAAAATLKRLAPLAPATDVARVAQARVAASKDTSKAPVVNVSDFGYSKVRRPARRLAAGEPHLTLHPPRCWARASCPTSRSL